MEKENKQKQSQKQEQNPDQNQKHRPYLDTNQEIIDSYDYLKKAASTQDCTGLIPAAPESDAELASYEELYHFLPPNGETEGIRTESETEGITAGIDPQTGRTIDKN